MSQHPNRGQSPDRPLSKRAKRQINAFLRQTDDDESSSSVLSSTEPFDPRVLLTTAVNPSVIPQSSSVLSTVIPETVIGRSEGQLVEGEQVPVRSTQPQMVPSTSCSAAEVTELVVQQDDLSVPSKDVPLETSPPLPLSNQLIRLPPTACEIEWQHFLTRGDESFIPTNIPCCTLDADEEDQVTEALLTPEHVNDPLYPGSSMSVQDCLVSLLTYAQSVKMSGQDFSKLLELLNLLLPQPNKLPKSTHHFFKCFEKDDGQLDIYYFCTICFSQRSNSKDSCPDCRDPKKQVAYFLICPMQQQLQKLYARPGFLEMLNYKNARVKKNDQNIEDIYDSTVYRDAEKTFLNNPHNVSLTWYTDGISLFECSSYTLWPFIFIINELPPQERYKPENVIFGGLWGCHEKPPANMFILPLYHQIKNLSEGFQVMFNGSKVGHTVEAHLLFGRCDMPAKASFMNIKGHAGYFSCPLCFIKGEKSARTGNVMVFPHNNNLELRSDQNYKACVLEGIKKIPDGHLGVMGPSVLSYMTSTSFLSSITIDVMHCVYLGVVKMLLGLWFNSTYSSESFSLSQKTQVVNDRLFALKLPHFVQRMPVGVDKLPYWKASLFRTFILYMCLVVMKGVMKQEYYVHIALLVEGLSLLNSSSVSHSDIMRADELLCKFCRDFETLYGLRHMTSNVHQLRHLSQSVLQTGNLCMTHCFQFEDLNGKLASLVHGTTHASLQIHSRLSLLTEAEKRVSSVRSLSLKFFCDKLFYNFNVSKKISQSIYVAGPFGHNSKYENDIVNLITNVHLFQTFEKLYKNRILYVSSSYGKGARKSSYCTYNFAGNIHHGEILTFVKTLDLSYYALVAQILLTSSDINRCFVDSGHRTGRFLIPVIDLVQVSFCFNVNNVVYVMEPLNPFELE
ncbi:LOW QUALITY PROTEIN: Phosphopentomutase [Frankliniella fusca]|uniref:Phosphopentomutase n=1 Tax=Frankliniella fusca TaxID=407009 RepID=A0AAE1H456_9NEOP|nr:LOW QUALITY PROTEIN: Phosphopentomutase [Frankliniella fusca]